MVNLKQQEARQQLSKEIEWWSRGKKAILLEICTSGGKTFNSLTIARATKSSKRTLILVPEIPLIDNFREDGYKHGFQDIIDNADIICYASLSKYVGNTYGNVICDEVHHFISEKRVSLGEQLKYDRIIGLSATVNEETEQILNDTFHFEKYTLTTSEGIARGILPEPSIIVKEMDLDGHTPRNKAMYGKKEKLLTDREYYKYISDKVTYWKDVYESGKMHFQRNKMLQNGNLRQKFLAKCKTEMAKELIKELNNERFICFCGSLEQANELGGSQVVSSEKSKKQNKELINRFNQNIDNQLFAKNMLKEGMNLKDCPYGIIIQLNNQEKDAIQQVGRILRSDSPCLYVLKVRDTVDERFFNSSFKRMNEEYITFES